ncbi:MAG: GNAT family N-acetyltransferase [Paenibacillaceae bacterium]|nr:GNAT family N-acetyltransferase [Paenibacillaceae bacterium]
MKNTLRLRPYKKEDGTYLLNWLTDRRMLGMWCRDHFSFPLSADQMERYYKELEKDSRSFGFTALNEKGIPVGSFRMSRVDYEKNSVHLGFIVIDQSLRGQGLGEQMVSLAVGYGKEFLGMERITLNVFDCNPGAKRCYEKVGFHEEQFKKEDFAFEEEKWGIYLMVYDK